ncbi:MAG: hypothetical protein LBE50_04995, partial [Gallionellaceae bacterium]|nr:hypothetical protein [Gallionellaceae bacterium]
MVSIFRNGKFASGVIACLCCASAFADTLTLRIDGVDDTLKPAVVAAAEISQYENQDISRAQVRRLYRKAPDQITKALEAFGYFN